MTGRPALRVGTRVVLDADRREATVDGRRVGLSPAETEIFHLLAAEDGRPVDPERLCAAGWGEGNTAGVQSVRAAVLALRRKLGAHADLVDNVRGTGYRCTGAVAPVPAVPAPRPGYGDCPPPARLYLADTGHLAQVVVDVARVLVARPVATAEDWDAMERLRTHPAVRALAGCAAQSGGRRERNPS